MSRRAEIGSVVGWVEPFLHKTNTQFGRSPMPSRARDLPLDAEELGMSATAINHFQRRRPRWRQNVEQNAQKYEGRWIRERKYTTYNEGRKILYSAAHKVCDTGPAGVGHRDADGRGPMRRAPSFASETARGKDGASHPFLRAICGEVVPGANAIDHAP
ncbi:hypothetical protein DFH06DRAFT_1146011 [Mycena polygramma]|nr:hypothetical protein DFH06DRAFT_1146011 [Mycena polygramma]